MLAGSEVLVEDRTDDLALVHSPDRSVAAGAIEFTEPPLFADDFESGYLFKWD